MKSFHQLLIRLFTKSFHQLLIKLSFCKWYEELVCQEVDDAIHRRLENGDPVTLPIGKLLERLLVFKTHFDQSSDENRKARFYPDLLRMAEDRLKQIK